MTQTYAEETLRATLHVLHKEEIMCLAVACARLHKNFHKMDRAAWDFIRAAKVEASYNYYCTHLRNIVHDSAMYQIACVFGYFGMLKRLGTLKVELPPKWYGTVLSAACAGGNLEVVKYVHNTFGLTDEHARNSSGLMEACISGHHEVVKYLRTGFRLTIDDVRRISNYIFYRICEERYIEVIKVLHTDYGLTGKDILSGDEYALEQIYRHSRIEILKYLHEHLGLTAERVRENGGSLRYAYKCADQQIIKYLHTEIGLTLEDIRAQNCRRFCAACYNNRHEVVRYLCTEVGVTAEDIKTKVSLKKCGPDVAEYFKTEFGIF